MLQHAFKAGLIALALGLVVEDASAFGHRGWGCGGGYGYGGCGYGGGGYAGYGYGGYGGCGGWYGAYGGYGGCGNPGYAYGGCGNARGCATAPGTAPAAAPATAPVGTPSTPPANYSTPTTPAPATSSTTLTPNRVMLAVNVPADAKVTINDHATTSKGEHRTYVSNNVQPDASYRYQVRVEFVRDGKPVSEEQTVSLTGGKSASLDFDAAAAQVADVATSSQR